MIKDHFSSIDQALFQSSGSMEVSFSKVDIEVLPVFMDAHIAQMRPGDPQGVLAYTPQRVLEVDLDNNIQCRS